MENCDLNLAQDILYDCSNPVVKGMGNTGYMFNYDDIDIDAITYNSDHTNVLSSLPLATGKRGYKVFVPGKTPFTGTATSMAEGTYRNTWTKSVSVIVLDAGPDVSEKVIDRLANGKFVVVLENMYKGSDGMNTFEVYGLEQGLSASAIEADKYSDDTQGGTSVTLQETDAPTFALYLFDGSVSATRALLESTTTEG